MPSAFDDAHDPHCQLHSYHYLPLLFFHPHLFSIENQLGENLQKLRRKLQVIEQEMKNYK